jgi:hypothetical protein
VHQQQQSGVTGCGGPACTAEWHDFSRFAITFVVCHGALQEQQLPSERYTEGRR